MSRRAVRPLDRDSVKAANDAFYARHPNRVAGDGRRIPLDATSSDDQAARSEWMDLYEEHGGAIEEIGTSRRKLAEPIEPCCDDSEDTSSNDSEGTPVQAAAPSDTPMRPCPVSLGSDEATPEGWQDYHGEPAVFHCGYRGILEDVVPGNGRMQNECFYDEEGNLVDVSHPYALCGGSPNEFDSDSAPFEHAFEDEGGIWERGWDAFWESRRRDVDEAGESLDRSMDQAGDWLERQWDKL